MPPSRSRWHDRVRLHARVPRLAGDIVAICLSQQTERKKTVNEHAQDRQHAHSIPHHSSHHPIRTFKLRLLRGPFVREAAAFVRARASVLLGQLRLNFLVVPEPDFCWKGSCIVVKVGKGWLNAEQ